MRYTSFPGGPFIAEVLRHLREIDPRGLLDGAGPGELEAVELETRLSRTEGRIVELQAELEGGGGEVRALVGSLRRMETERDELAAQLARVRADRHPAVERVGREPDIDRCARPRE